MPEVPSELSLVKENVEKESKETDAEFKAAVGLSRQWDARKARREVAYNTLEKLDGKKPDFFLLFFTTH